MRRSRGLAFKREQEQKLGSLLNRDSANTRVNSSSHVPEIDSSSRRTIPAPSAVRPDARSMREALKDIRDIKKPVSKPARRQVDSDEEEEHHETDKEEVHDDRHEESEDDRERYEEEEEVKPVVQKGRAMKPNNHRDEIKPKVQPKQVDAAPKAQRGRKPKVQEPEVEEEEERSERNERTDRVEREDVDEDKRRKMIVPKSFFQKMIATANIDTTSSDIFPTLQQEMIDYIVEVIKIVSNNEDDEVVVKDSNLRFLGEKDKAVGNLDVKLFEKLYSEAQKILVHNVTFTSESFKSLCKYTEIHVLDFLKKARALMAHAGRKRLTLADIELLKFILE